LYPIGITDVEQYVRTIKHVVLDDNVQIAFVPATTETNFTNWWQSEDGIVGLFAESPKLLYYSAKYHTPLGGCWNGGMNPIKVLAISSLGMPLSFFLVVAIRWYALRRKKLDVPNDRSSHSMPTPRGGGIAIVSVTLALLLLGTGNQADIRFTRVIAFIIAGILIAAIGLIDDWWKTPSAKIRLMAHFAVALAFTVASGVITELYIPALGDLYLGPVPGGVMTLFWLAGLINVYNFMDGSDGLAGTQAFLGGSAWSLIFFLEGQETLALLSGLIAATSLGFLAMNTPPAKIFMGDVGSTFLGFSLSALTVTAFTEMGNPRLLVTGILIVGVFVFDATFTIFRRMRNGENLLEAHCSHLYQRLIKLGHSHATVCARYGFLMALSALVGLLYYFSDSEVIGLGALIGILTLYLGLAGWVTWLESDRASGSKSQNRLATTHKLETDK